MLILIPYHAHITRPWVSFLSPAWPIRRDVRLSERLDVFSYVESAGSSM
jgi:hypothetical protein